MWSCLILRWFRPFTNYFHAIYQKDNLIANNITSKNGFKKHLTANYYISNKTVSGCPCRICDDAAIVAGEARPKTAVPLAGQRAGVKGGAAPCGVRGSAPTRNFAHVVSVVLPIPLPNVLSVNSFETSKEGVIWPVGMSTDPGTHEASPQSKFPRPIPFGPPSGIFSG